MKTKFLSLVLCLVAASAFAQSNPKLKELEPFVGNWKCTGTAFASEMGPEHATTATVHASWILGGSWLEIHFTEMKTAKNPHPVDFEGFWSYDMGLKKFVAGSIDNMAAYGTAEASGWQGDKLVFTGPLHMGGMAMTARDTFTKAPNTIHHLGEVEVKGAWKKVNEETCRK